MTIIDHLRIIIGDIEEPERTEDQSSDLLLAGAEGNTVQVRALLKKKANLKVRDEEKKTALHLAAHDGHTEVVRLLVQKGTRSLQDKDKRTPLHMGAPNVHADAVGVLLQSGADPNLYDQNTWTALHYATWRGHEIVVQKPIGRAYINAQDRLGQNPLHLAAERGNVEIVRNLLSEVPDSDMAKYLDVRCNDNQTVLHRAAWGRSEMVVRIVSRACDRNKCQRQRQKDSVTCSR